MKKKVLFLIPNLQPGGAERVLVNLVNNLDQDKFDVTLQTLFDVGVNKQYLLPHVRYIGGWKKQPRGMTQLMKFCSTKFLYTRVVKERYDIVVSYLEGPTARVLAGCRDKNVKTVSWIHTQFITDAVAKIGFRSLKDAVWCYNQADAIVAVGQTVKEGFLSKIPTDKDVKVLYNTNETEQIVEKAQEEVETPLSEGINVCSVGKLIPVKAFERLIRVHKRLVDENYPHHVYFLGEGNERERLEKLIKELGVENSVTLLGFQKNPYAYVARSDMYVCSSLREGFSTAVTEALVLGTPVVTTECSGMKELLGNNNEYGIVTENSEDGLYEGMKKMLSNPELLKGYREKAKERGKAFSREATVRAVEEMLLSL